MVSRWLAANQSAQGLELLPGCAVPGHVCSPSGVEWSSRSWVIELLPGCGIPGHVKSPLRSRVVTSRSRNRRWRCPRSSLVLSRSGASYIQVADSNAMPSQVMGTSFLAVVVSVCQVPAHQAPGTDGVSRFRGCPRSSQSSRQQCRTSGQRRHLAKDFACIPGHRSPPRCIDVCEYVFSSCLLFRGFSRFSFAIRSPNSLCA